MQRSLCLTESTFDFHQVNADSVLLTEYTEDLPSGAYHTSLGDLTVDTVIKMASQFDAIEFEPQGFDTRSNVYKETLLLYQYLTRQYKNTGHKALQFTDHSGIDDRLDQPMLWVFGCSHSHGVGLRHNESNYGKLLSQQLNLPLKLITKPGSSLHWSYRHLMNSGIQPQDTVIWQLTTPGRISQFNGEKVREIILSSSKDRKLIDSVSDDQLYFNQLSLLNTGVQFIRSIGCRFAITAICDFDRFYDYILEYVKYPEYCHSYGMHIDRGTDGQHAGPLSHKAIAQRLLDHLQSYND